MSEEQLESASAETETIVEIEEAAPSRMDSIEAAFDTAFDVDDDKKDITDDRPRGEDGRFIASEAPETAPETPETPVETTTELGPLDVPARFSADAKAVWDATPEALRGEVNRALRELEEGITQKTQALDPLKPFFDMAEQQGVTVHGALQNYINMENMLRSNPAEGFRALVQNMGISPQDVIGYFSEPEQPTEISGLKGEIQNLNQTVQSMQQNAQQQQMQQINATLEDFAKDKPLFDDLADDMAKLIQQDANLDLQGAYDKALERVTRIAGTINPAPQAQAQTPPPAKSVTGAPGAGSNPTTVQPSKTRNEAVARAFGAVGL